MELQCTCTLVPFCIHVPCIGGKSALCNGYCIIQHLFVQMCLNLTCTCMCMCTCLWFFFSLQDVEEHLVEVWPHFGCSATPAGAHFEGTCTLCVYLGGSGNYAMESLAVFVCRLP